MPVNNEKPRVVIGFELMRELNDYIADQEKQSPLTIYQLETALRNLKKHRRAETDPRMGGRRATLDQSIQFFEDLLEQRREQLGETPCDPSPPPTPLQS